MKIESVKMSIVQIFIKAFNLSLFKYRYFQKIFLQMRKKCIDFFYKHLSLRNPPQELSPHSRNITKIIFIFVILYYHQNQFSHHNSLNATYHWEFE